jgi:prepilin-type N-terminal cleavage/methylation domain-containing protein
MLGFTLVELSIVLVVIGLLVGGVLIGANLLNSATIRGTISGLEDIKTATTTFESMYQGLPGDLTNADQIWPNCATPATNCNGDGDGRIDVTERFRALQQLSDAGMTGQRFTGTGSNPVNIATDVIRGKFDGSGMMLGYVNATDFANARWDANSDRNVVFLGGSAQFTTAPVIPAADAQVIDDKIDDGRPGTGKLQASDQTNTNCALNATSYAIAVTTTRGCALNFSIQ